MNYPQQATGYRMTFRTSFSSTVTPNVFIGGPDPDSPGFPLKACGNDGLWIGDLLDAAS